MHVRTSQSHPLEIDTLGLVGRGRLGLTFCPGKVDPHARVDGCQREPVRVCRPILLDHASRNVVQFLWLQEAMPVPRDQGERATKCV